MWCPPVWIRAKSPSRTATTEVFVHPEICTAGKSVPPEIRTSDTPYLRKSVPLELRAYGTPYPGNTYLRKSIPPEIRTSAYPEIPLETRKSVHPEMRTSGNPHLWKYCTFGNPYLWKYVPSEILTLRKFRGKIRGVGFNTPHQRILYGVDMF